MEARVRQVKGMRSGGVVVTRRAVLGLAAACLACPAGLAHAMGQSGAFCARQLTTGNLGPPSADRASSLVRWGWELVRRTSAPARLVVSRVAADSAELLDEPFVVWLGDRDPGPLSSPELRGIEAYLRLGGVLVVDDTRPEIGEFGRAARRELQRILPESSVLPLPPSHVIYKSFYLVERPQGRILGSGRIDAIVRGKVAQVLFLDCDLTGALAVKADGAFQLPTEPGGAKERERAIRLAVNIAMYVLCSDYKDDQVHASWLMRRRARGRP